MTSASRLALATILLGASLASATPADDAFKRGRELVKAGKFAEACAAFEESQRLDPSLGTQFNIAQCLEKTGKPASALKIYKDLAQYDTNGTRKAAAADLGGKLEPRVPRLTLTIAPKPPQLAITLDGVACADCVTGSVFVDHGPHTLVASAPGFADATASATIAKDGEIVPVTLTLAPSATTTATTAVAPLVATSPSPPRSSRKRFGTIAVIGGGAIVATGAVFGVLARGTWSDAKAVCGGSTTCANDADTDRASALGDTARSRATVSTALFVVGGAAVATGVVLWLTSPKERAVIVGGTATPSSASVTLSGRF